MELRLRERNDQRRENIADADQMIDEYTRESLAIRVARRLNSHDVIDTLAGAMVEHGVPEHIRSDNGPEFIAKRVRTWLAVLGTQPLYIEPGSPWVNGYCESFNSKLRDEFLNGEIFYSLKEAQVLTERWRKHYNTLRPHSSLAIDPRRRPRWKVVRSVPWQMQPLRLTPQLVQKIGQSTVGSPETSFT
jgi:transposase InsO family protein